MSDERAVAEMKAFYNDYLASWNSSDPATLRRVYAYPWVSTGRNGISVTADENAQRGMWKHLWDDLKARGWHHTGSERVDAYPMGADAGLLDVDYVRYRADGSVLERGHAQYIVRRYDAGWKIVGLIEPHAKA